MSHTPLRIGFDMDGVLADFAQAFQDVERELFGEEAPPVSPEAPEAEEARESAAEASSSNGNGEPTEGERERLRERVKQARAQRRRRDKVWEQIRSTPDFWTTLKPLDEGAVRRIHELMLRHRWEVFFITQRPATSGATVQRQTQRWLVEQGFDLPSVLVIGGSRGAAAGAMRLDYHVDDSAQNCLDVIADSRAKPILITPNDPPTIASARKLGIGTVSTIADALDLLDRVSVKRAQPGALERLAAMIGWK